MKDHTVKCKDCGFLFPKAEQESKKPCPECGSTIRDHFLSFKDTGTISDKVGIKIIKEFYEENRPLKIAVWIINIAAPLLGLFVGGIFGFIIGLIFAVISSTLTPYATLKVREISHIN